MPFAEKEGEILAKTVVEEVEIQTIQEVVRYELGKLIVGISVFAALGAFFYFKAKAHLQWQNQSSKN